MVIQRFETETFGNQVYLDVFYDVYVIFVLQYDYTFESIFVYSQTTGEVAKEGSIYESAGVEYAFDVKVNRN